MARGWESKSVEEQQSEFNREKKPAHTTEDVQRTTRLQSLRLQRARVEAQLQNAENPRFIELLRRELEHLDSELRKLEAPPAK